MKKVNIGIVGLGTIGTGVSELLRKNGTLIRSKSGINIVVKKYCDVNRERMQALAIPPEKFTTSSNEVISDPEIEIVVELVGGTTFAKELLKHSIEKKKHIVTANKALLAHHARELLPLITKHGVELGCEASVGGGIPIIKTIREALVGNKIYKIVGILNGTTNFILTKMTREHMSFESALTVAREMGFAEADPTLDLKGIDAQHKITILASLAFNTHIDLERVYTEGIESIDVRDVEYAGELGFVMKLLAIAEKTDGGILVRVHPSLVSRENPLAAIDWEDNAIMVYSDFLGKSMYYGKGAGAKPTASAVVADITEIASKIKSNYEYNPACYSFFEALHQLEFTTSTTRYYFRFNALDRPGILSKISGILGDHNISIASVIQKETEEQDEHVPLVMLTHAAREADVREAFSRIDELDEVSGKSRLLRVIDE